MSYLKANTRDYDCFSLSLSAIGVHRGWCKPQWIRIGTVNLLLPLLGEKWFTRNKIMRIPLFLLWPLVCFIFSSHQINPHKYTHTKATLSVLQWFLFPSFKNVGIFTWKQFLMNCDIIFSDPTHQLNPKQKLYNQYWKERNT